MTVPLAFSLLLPFSLGGVVAEACFTLSCSFHTEQLDVSRGGQRVCKVIEAASPPKVKKVSS